MENSVGKVGGGSEIGGKKSKVLGLERLYKSVSGGGSEGKSGAGAVGNGDEVGGSGSKKKRKRRKEVALSSFERGGKKGKGSLDDSAGRSERSGLGLEGRNGLEVGLSQKVNGGGSSSGGLNCDLIGFDLNGDGLCIPKRRRGLVGRNKFANNRAKVSGSSSSIDQCGEIKVVKKEVVLNEICNDAEPSESKGDSGVGEIQRSGGSGKSDQADGKVSSKEPNKEKRQRSKVSRKSGSSRSKTKVKVEHKEIQLNGSSSKPGLSEGKESSKSEQKEVQRNTVSGNLEPQENKLSSVVEVVKLNNCSGGKDITPKDKRKRKSDGSKVNRKDKEFTEVSSSQHDSSEGGHLIVNKGGASASKRLKNHRKRKVPTSGREIVVPSVDNVIRNLDVLPEDDEENLEQNAARMLSSRFDPSCTGLSSKNRTSPSSSANKLSFLASPTQKLGNRKLAAASESTSTDKASRVLRPRNQSKGKGLSRKRRHFYEILPKDLDALWFLNRRIKIFWPLDESWYYGLVDDYDSEKMLHHIKYDDRDEEWISLQNERFKLLLLPSEVPSSKAKIKESSVETSPTETDSRNLDTKDDASIECRMESEPIISWLGHSSLRIKSYTSALRKKQKTAHLPSDVVIAPSSDKSDVACGNAGTCLLESETSNLCQSSTLPIASTDERNGNLPAPESSGSAKGGHLPVVYVRRRKKNASGGSDSSTHIARSSQLSEKAAASLECSCSNDLSWSLNNSRILELNVLYRESKEFTFEVCVSLRPILDKALGTENMWLIHNILLLRYGTIMITWPTVQLEVLFVDNVVGLRFFLFEGCIRHAVELVFLVLSVSCEPDKQSRFIDFQMPVSSIRFKLSCIQDMRKQRTYAYYSFSKVKTCSWSYLDAVLQPQCLLFKRLSLPECTYDNIKSLEGGSRHLRTSSSSSMVLRKKPMPGVMRKSRNLNRSLASSRPCLKKGTLPPFALSFTAAPTFFHSLHLKLLMERSITSISLQGHSSRHSLDRPGDISWSVADEENRDVDLSEGSAGSDPTSETIIFTGEACSELTCKKPQLVMDVHPERIGAGLTKIYVTPQNEESDTVKSSVVCRYPGNTAVDVSSKPGKCGGSSPFPELYLQSVQPSFPVDHAFSVSSTARCHSNLGGMSVEIPVREHVDRDLERGDVTPHVSDLAWNLGDGIVSSPNLTEPRSSWPSNRYSPSTSSLRHRSQALPEGKTDLILNGFGNGPRKPRTQVHYTMPFGVQDLNSKHKIHTQNGMSFKRIRRANDKRIGDGTRGPRRNLELVACDANLLITEGDKGWREGGARVFLEVTEQNDWRLAVKLRGMTKYSHKVTQDLQPGSTNRYTHAMMWKGGKDWVLEFPDRSQWMLFKEMHEECHNRNIRAASVKNIPIPGVRFIEEFEDYEAERLFLRSPKYFRQVETDVDMAMDPSNILYDMDSDDEEWLEKNNNLLQSQEAECEILSDELFEKTMDLFEKVSYTQQRDHFTVDELEEFEAGPSKVIKAIYEHWRQKRQRKGMALIRQLQPPLWQRYQQQVKQWEKITGKPITAPSSGSQDKTPLIEKPPMFAFCLKPRGLEVLHRGSKHRPHKKYLVSLNNHVYGDHNSPRPLGRRVNGHSYGNERTVFRSNSHESSDFSPPPYASTMVFTPRDAVSHGYFSLNADASEWNHHPRSYSKSSRKIGSLSPPSNPKMMASFNQQRRNAKRDGVHQWNNMDTPDWSVQNHQQPEPSYMHQIQQLGGPDLEEFRLRDASGAAKHALNMAKLKRERAQKLLYRADLAIHRAVSALMTAEAIKASYGNSSGEG